MNKRQRKKKTPPVQQEPRPDTERDVLADGRTGMQAAAGLSAEQVRDGGPLTRVWISESSGKP